MNSTAHLPLPRPGGWYAPRDADCDGAAVRLCAPSADVAKDGPLDDRFLRGATSSSEGRCPWIDRPTSSRLALGPGISATAPQLGHFAFLPACSCLALRPFPQFLQLNKIIGLTPKRKMTRLLDSLAHEKGSRRLLPPLAGLAQPVERDSPTDSQTGVRQVIASPFAKVLVFQWSKHLVRPNPNCQTSFRG